MTAGEILRPHKLRNATGYSVGPFATDSLRPNSCGNARFAFGCGVRSTPRGMGTIHRWKELWPRFAQDDFVICR